MQLPQKYFEEYRIFRIKVSGRFTRLSEDSTLAEESTLKSEILHNINVSKWHVHYNIDICQTSIFFWVKFFYSCESSFWQLRTTSGEANFARRGGFRKSFPKLYEFATVPGRRRLLWSDCLFEWRIFSAGKYKSLGKYFHEIMKYDVCFVCTVLVGYSVCWVTWNDPQRHHQLCFIIPKSHCMV